jgi:hypothetical protein
VRHGHIQAPRGDSVRGPVPARHGSRNPRQCAGGGANSDYTAAPAGVASQPLSGSAWPCIGVQAGATAGLGRLRRPVRPALAAGVAAATVNAGRQVTHGRRGFSHPQRRAGGRGWTSAAPRRDLGSSAPRACRRAGGSRARGRLPDRPRPISVSSAGPAGDVHRPREPIAQRRGQAIWRAVRRRRGSLRARGTDQALGGSCALRTGRRG